MNEKKQKMNIELSFPLEWTDAEGQRKEIAQFELKRLKLRDLDRMPKDLREKLTDSDEGGLGAGAQGIAAFLGFMTGIPEDVFLDLDFEDMGKVNRAMEELGFTSPTTGGR